VAKLFFVPQEEDFMQKIAFAIIAIGLGAAPALAEEAPSGIKRTPVQSIDFPEGYKTVTGLAEVAPGHASGPHTHPGIETGYVLDGEVLMIVEGQPDRKLKAGDSFLVPAKAISVFVVDKSQPLASPAK
jgi:quercetin dioxygenase-like cupin family protein